MAHGSQSRSGLNTPLGEFFPNGMFGRMFPALPPLAATEVTPATLQLLFRFSGGSGTGVPIPSDWIIDWRRFFNIDASVSPNLSRRLDPFVINALGNLPEFASAPVRLRSLSFRNLVRGVRLRLPSGQSVARLMGLTPLTVAEIFQRRRRGCSIGERADSSDPALVLHPQRSRGSGIRPATWPIRKSYSCRGVRGFNSG